MLIAIGGLLAADRSHPDCTILSCGKEDIQKFHALVLDPDAREKIQAEARAMIADDRIWRAIEALAVDLYQRLRLTGTERARLTGAEATEVIEAAANKSPAG